MEFWNYILENFLLLGLFFAGYELFLRNSRFFVFTRFLFQSLQLKRLIITSEHILEVKGVKLKQSPKNCGAFSFFNYIFLDIVSHKNSKNHVLRHQLIHAQQYHGLDILFINLVQNFLWFNPLIYCYKNRIITNLEFITDHAVMKKASVKNLKNELKNYQYHLLSQSLAIQHLPILSFNHSSIKKRIIMLNKKAGHKLQLFKISFLIPCFCFIFYSCNVDDVVSLEESAEYSFYFDHNTSEKDLQNRVKMFNHFYESQVTLRITDTDYQNNHLNGCRISQKFKDQPNFGSGYQTTGLYTSDISFLVSYKEGKIILSSSNNYRIELDKNSNQIIISGTGNKE
ncbi:M56 family metallopeptidase [Zunongwangia pacifica]|uniref:Peptidase M56 domain-containing protein n=1 Tax=Zunongwangia pacifica TaxID=2911062 RepID=A0A9X1ZU87_9FLAO|nr:M56 family metallopeptidase [Zunongwangia pacifica]MCL6217670.1 hypothetical protein [Zunongwangia pacifica]